VNPVVELRGIVKRFPGVVALDRVDVDLRPCEVLGLIGQNGSGKSTLVKAIAGVQEPDEGEIRVRGVRQRLASPQMAASLGIGMVHQEQSLIGSLTVAENIYLDKPSDSYRFGWYRWRRLFDAARRQLDKIELDIEPDALVSTLTFAQRQMVELAKVLAVEELVEGQIVILFDEPTSVLGRSDIEALFRQIRRIGSRASVVFISHRMDEVLEISDRVYVLSDGEKVAERNRGATDPGELYKLMVGRQRAPDDARQSRLKGSEPQLLEMRGIVVPGHVHGVNLTVGVGEIVALIGVQASGAEELCRGLFGLNERMAGEISFAGHPAHIKGPTAAIALGIGYLPAERKVEGMVRGQTIAENIALTFGLDFGRAGTIIDRGEERREARLWADRLKLKATGIDERIERLSGGNQQKVVLAKWLMGRNLKLLILDHPTRGLDPGARGDVFRAIRELAASGLAILFIGDTLDEVLSLADALHVMRDGRITQSFPDLAAHRPHEEEIVRAMV
jgi:ribose transport system ATP-binding protein